MPALLLAALPGLAMELPGIAEPPRLGGMPAGWVEWGNDFFGAAPASVSDDYRTNRFMGGWRVGDWYGGIDYSMLTVIFPAGKQPHWWAPDPFEAMSPGQARSDELTLAVGRRVQGGGPVPWWLGGGVGARIDGNLGGGTVQRGVHQVLDDQILDLPYERQGTRATPLVHAQAGAILPLGGPDAPVVLRPMAAGLATGLGEVQAHYGARLAYRGAEGAIWFGLVEELRFRPDGRVASLVADHEEGRWSELGVEYGSWSFQVGRGGSDPAVEGAIAYAIAPEPSVATFPDAAIEYGVATTTSLDPGNGPSAAIRLPPWWLPPGSWLARHASLAIDYRRSELTTHFSYDLEAWWEEVLAGVDVQLTETPRTGFAADPFLVAEGGWHRGAITTPGITLPSPEARVSTGVVRGGVGVRWSWGWEGDGRAWRTGLTTLVDWIQPFAEVSAPYHTLIHENPPPLIYSDGVTTISQPGYEVLIRWFGHVDW